MADPIIIIGSGLAGFNTIKELRRHDTSTPVVMLTADDGQNYSKPMLSTGFTRNKTADELVMATVDKLKEQFSVDLRPHTVVTSVDVNAKQVSLENGDTLAYSKLVLANGAKVFEPPLKGSGLDAVYTVNNLMDYRRFREALEGKKRVVIVGSGLIGTEFSNDLTNGEYQVHVVEPAGRCLPTFLPEEASLAVSGALSELGVTFHFGPFAKEVEKLDEGVRVHLSDGATIDADIVLSAVGLQPNVDLAKAAGLEVGRGVKVDKFLRTSHPDVFALGDCAEVEGHVLLYILPLMAAARALANTLAGTDTAVTYPAMPITIKVPACAVACAPPPLELAGRWEVEQDGHHVKALYYDTDDQLRGFALTGDAVKERMALGKQLPNLF